MSLITEDVLREGSAQYIPNFISEEEEKQLITCVDAEDWDTESIKRRTQHYGYKYNYKKSEVDDVGEPGEPLPKWCDFLLDRLVDKKIFKNRPDQIIVNEYLPNQGIAHHTDSIFFGETIASLSLNSNILMNLKTWLSSSDSKAKKLRSNGYDIFLEQKSLLVFNDESRFFWTHGIYPRKTDLISGVKIERDRRISLTFRNVNNHHS